MHWPMLILVKPLIIYSREFRKMCVLRFKTILRNVAGSLDVEEILDDSGIRTLLQTVGIVGIVVFAILAALEITLACFGCNSKLNKTNIEFNNVKVQQSDL